MHLNTLWRRNFADEHFALHVTMVVNAKVEFYTVYNGMRARDLMLCLCHEIAV